MAVERADERDGDQLAQSPRRWCGGRRAPGRLRHAPVSRPRPRPRARLRGRSPRQHDSTRDARCARRATRSRPGRACHRPLRAPCMTARVPAAAQQHVRGRRAVHVDDRRPRLLHHCPRPAGERCGWFAARARAIARARPPLATRAQRMRAHVYAHAHAQAADTLSGKLVESKLAACVNVIPGIKSTYLWEGKIENDYVSSLLCRHPGRLLSTTRAATRCAPRRPHAPVCWPCLSLRAQRAQPSGPRDLHLVGPKVNTAKPCPLNRRSCS